MIRWSLVGLLAASILLPGSRSNATTQDPILDDAGAATILLSSYANACGQIGYQVGSLDVIMSAFMATLEKLKAAGLSEAEGYAYAQDILDHDGETLEGELKIALGAVPSEQQDRLWPGIFTDLIDRRCASLADHAGLASLITASSPAERKEVRRTLEAAISRQSGPAL